ncbi:protein FAR1-RELATED SEQUENCE 3-like [Lotus japonicus]|uniref:protein FAR1-RELATED SEQUENCE 3-like n=1 Tax=Lotus japonicus TaxID=34305 RepID=UPI002588CCA7|nr:protein FAR1-RELATED SEQUENCE 3-like [Lotus japonicus]
MDVQVINMAEEGSGRQTIANGGDAERSKNEVNGAGNNGSHVQNGVSEPRVKEHSHSMVSGNKVNNLLPRRHFSSVGRTMPETYQGVGLVPSGVMSISLNGSHSATENIHGIRNNPAPAAAAGETSRPVKIGPVSMNYTVRRPPTRNRTFGRDAQNMLEYFKKVQAENPGFFYAIQLDEDSHMSNVFWADARSRAAYSHFGDAVSLDTTYRVYQYRVPFAPFTGVNHHGQMILFGCALLLDNSEASFVWLLKTFLTAMNGRHPVSITTDQDRAIQTAVSQVMPQVRHRINKWDVLREGHEKLAHVCHSHPNFQVELYNCINLTETIEEFDSSWNSIISKYELGRNDWLQSLYGIRAKWVPAYFRDSFFAVISPNQRFGGSFFDGFVNQQTTLPIFFRQYELALESWFEKEIESDFETICTTPVLKTPSPMEKQAADLYTQKIFLKFQEELVETFAYTANRVEEDGENSIFRVAKFEDDQKSYIVILNHSELRANCTCHMFEYSGILCRHVLTVFMVTNIFTLPSHYILKRWTRNAKSSVGSVEEVGESHGHESLTSRYASLCREAIRYAEEGAIAMETYDAAMSALTEGGKKIAAVTRSIAKVAQPNDKVSGTACGERKTPTLTSDTTPFLWPLQVETTRRYLNDAGAPVQSGSIRYAGEGATAMETCDAARGAPREGGKKIPVTKRSIAKGVQPNDLVSGTAYGERKTPTSDTSTTPLLWPQQDETTRRFNLNDAGAPVQSVSNRYAEEGAISRETYDATISAPREGAKKITVMKRSIAKVALPNSGTAYGERKTPTLTSDTSTTPPVWPLQDETTRFNLNDSGASVQLVADRNLPQTSPVSLQQDDGPPENMVALPCLKTMTWVMQNKNSTPESRVAVINLKLQDFNRTPSIESVVTFNLTSVSLEPMLNYMTHINEQLSTPASKVAVINLKLEDTQTSSGESEVKFQVSRDTLGAVLRSMTYIRKQLSCAGDVHSETTMKRHRK